MNEILYMDHQATTPAANSVLTAMSDYWDKSFGNPHSNGHSVGWKANAAISKAASNVATLIGRLLLQLWYYMRCSMAYARCNSTAYHHLNTLDEHAEQLANLGRHDEIH